MQGAHLQGFMLHLEVLLLLGDLLPQRSLRGRHRVQAKRRGGGLAPHRVQLLAGLGKLLLARRHRLLGIVKLLANQVQLCSRHPQSPTEV